MKEKFAVFHYIYILETANRKYYAGYTTDLKRRMAEHRSGKGSKFVRAQKQALIRHQKRAKGGSLQVRESM